MAPPRRNVAIFLDMENLFGGYGGLVATAPIRQLLNEIELVASGLGVMSAIAVKRAYANWSDARLMAYRQMMTEGDVEPVQVFSFGHPVKNAADIELVVDALSRAIDSPGLDVFVLVTGDGGFVPLVRRLHALGRYVIVVTTANSDNRRNSNLLKAAADYFHVLGDPIPGTRSDQAPSKGEAPEVGRTPTTGPIDAEIVDTVRKLFKREPTLLSNDGTVVNSALLGTRLQELWPAWRAHSRFPTVAALAEEALGRRLTALGASRAHLCSGKHHPGSSGPGSGDFGVAALGADIPSSKEDYVVCLKQLVASPLVASAVAHDRPSGGLLMARFAQLLRTLAPHLDHRTAGFPTLTLALRFGLSGTEYCLVASGGGSDHRVTRREWATDTIPDLEADHLGSPTVLREVLARSTPSLRFDSQEATTAVAVFLTSPETLGLAGKAADYLERLENCSDLPRSMLRIALTLHIAVGVLRGDNTLTFTERHLEIDPFATTYEAVCERLRSRAEEVLNRWRWPYSSEDLNRLLPRPLIRSTSS